MSEKLTYIDLFAGAGGFTEGFIKAGFFPVAHIELDKYAALSLKTRLAFHFLKKNNKKKIYFKYISHEIDRNEFYNNIPDFILSSVLNMEIKKDNIKSLFEFIYEQMKKTGIKKINVIAGGPPCQTYSLIGRARNSDKTRNDKRNYLYKLYVEFLREFKPEIFVFENVPGLLSAEKGKFWDDIQKMFIKTGYRIDYRILNSKDFGVLQNRRRIFIVGWRKELNLDYPEFKNNNNENYTVKDVLKDLPPLQPGERILTGEYIDKPSEYLLKYNIRTYSDILTLHIARNHNDRDREIYRFYIEKWKKEKRRPEYDELPEYLKTHRNRKVFKDRFKVIAPDLPYSQTIMAHLEKDGHYFIHPDINQLRSISVREAARLQSFPDNFYFEGPMTAMFRQIGNAVPPLMAEKIAKKIKEMLNA